MEVAILGASANPSRYSFKAAQRLIAAGHHPVGVNPKLPTIANLEVVSSIDALRPNQHTLTIYVAPEKSRTVAEAILKHGFVRVIFNPGAENPELQQRLSEAGVEVVEACTLVMLATGEF